MGFDVYGLVSGVRQCPAPKRVYSCQSSGVVGGQAQVFGGKSLRLTAGAAAPGGPICDSDPRGLSWGGDGEWGSVLEGGFEEVGSCFRS